MYIYSVIHRISLNPRNIYKYLFMRLRSFDDAIYDPYNREKIRFLCLRASYMYINNSMKYFLNKFLE